MGNLRQITFTIFEKSIGEVDEMARYNGMTRASHINYALSPQLMRDWAKRDGAK